MEWEVLQNVLASLNSELPLEFESFLPLFLHLLGVLLVQGGFCFGKQLCVFPTSRVGLEEPGEPRQAWDSRSPRQTPHFPAAQAAPSSPAQHPQQLQHGSLALPLLHEMCLRAN